MLFPSEVEIEQILTRCGGHAQFTIKAFLVRFLSFPFLIVAFVTIITAIVAVVGIDVVVVITPVAIIDIFGAGVIVRVARGGGSYAVGGASAAIATNSIRNYNIFPKQSEYFGRLHGLNAHRNQSSE